MGMATSKKTLTPTINMQHTATIIMVQRLVVDTISTLLTMQEATIILIFIVAIRTPVPIVVVLSGLEALISALMT